MLILKITDRCRHLIARLRLKPQLCSTLLLTLVFLVNIASAQTFKTIHSFGNAPDGNYPYAAGTFDANGNLFGTTEWGGANGSGTIWKISKAGAFSIAYNFVGSPDGGGPGGTVVFDAAGNMYGTAQYGGINGYGTVWKMSPSGTVTTLYSFQGANDGSKPVGNVALDSLGNVYGVAVNGSLGYGTLWVINTLGTFTILHQFTGQSDGAYPGAGPTFDANGNLFGTTYGGASIGGNYGEGTIWELSKGGIFSVVHTFTGGADGSDAFDSVIFDAAGNMYGTTGYGGANYSGTVWKIDTTGTFTELHAFTGGADGATPAGSVVFDASGNLFGTAGGGGSASDGTAWEITNSGKFILLETFSGTNGANPNGSLVVDSNGTLFGTTIHGGLGSGTLFQITGASAGLHTVATTATNILAGQSTTGTVSLLSPVQTDTVVSLSASDTNIQVPATVTIPAGTLSATFTVTSSPLYTAPDAVKVIASYGGKTVNCPLGISLTAVVHSVSLSPSLVTGGGSSTGTVYLSGNAPVDVTVNLSSSSTSAQVPATVVIPSGSNSATFAVTTSPVYVGTILNLSATLGSRTVTCGLAVGPTDSLHYITATPSSVVGGGTSTGTVYLSSPAPVGGTVVNLSASSLDVQVPATVTIPSGSVSTTFTVTAGGVFNAEYVSISATLGNKTVSCGFGIGPSAVMHYVVIAPGTVIGGTSTTGTVFLNGPAPIGGAVISLSSSNACSQVPATVTIPAGSSSTTFTVTSSTVTSNTNLTVTATLNSKSASCGMLVCAPQLAQVHVPETTLAGGTSMLVTVSLTGPAPAGGYLVNLSSSSLFATLPATVTIPAGATSAQVTLTTTAPTTQTAFIISATDSSKTLSVNMLLNPK